MSGAGGLKPWLARVADGGALSADEAAAAFALLMAGEASPGQIGALLMGLRVRGETVDEIEGAVRAMRGAALTVAAPAGAMDIVGTGGDGAGTLNISTAAAIVTAACGVPVAKHGNRALSSKCGAADVLEALGVAIDVPPEVVERSIAEAGFGFLLAPRYHSAMRHVGPVRVELGVRTIFNLLGPLANPAGVRRQFSGVFADRWIEPMATVLGRLGSERAWVVHGCDGLDELTLTGPSRVAEWRDGTVRVFEVTPADAGLPTCTSADLKGGDRMVNAQAIRALLDGRQGPFHDAAVYNAAGALIVAGRVENLRDGAALAAAAIDDGHARAVLERVVALTSEGVVEA